jgi:hypothetical protein
MSAADVLADVADERARQEQRKAEGRGSCSST